MNKLFAIGYFLLFFFNQSCGGEILVDAVPEDEPCPSEPDVVITYGEATIFGLENIDDTMINGGAYTTNWGLFPYIHYGQSDTWRPLIRFNEALIPDGELISLTYHFYANAHFSSGDVRVLRAYRLTDANVWAEGDGAGYISSTPAATWNGPQSTATVNTWAGSIGCSTPGVDYIADENPPSVDVNGEWSVFALPVEWAVLWRDGLAVNNGFMLRDDEEPGNGSFFSTEAEFNQPYFKVKYRE